jgi:hypothetical protein
VPLSWKHHPDIAASTDGAVNSAKQNSTSDDASQPFHRDARDHAGARSDSALRFHALGAGDAGAAVLEVMAA